MESREPWRLPDDLSYEDWVNYVFDHPIVDPRWWFQDEDSGLYQFWDDRADRTRTLSYLTRFFRAPERVLARFNRTEIDQGLNLLFSASSSSHMAVLDEPALSWEKRRECFDAMVMLYAKLMAPVYGNDLGHLQHCDHDRATYSCYMLWDVVHLWPGMGNPDDRLISEAVLSVFERVLTLRSEACLESALHGLGHWHLRLPERTEPIVREFLKRTDISPVLREYAERAAIGNVQ